MAEKPQGKAALLYAIILALATASSSPFWLQPVTDFVGPKIKFFSCNNSWLNPADYRSCFEALSSNYYPAIVQGRLTERAGEQFSAKWKNVPAGSFCYLSCYAVSQDGLNSTKTALKDEPAFDESVTSFIGAGGQNKFSVTWTWSPPGQCKATCP